MTTIRCSTSPTCRASTQIRPEHVAPGDRRPARRRRTRRSSASTSDAVPADYDAHRRPCSTSRPSAWRAPGARSSHLNAVADTPELRAAYNEDLPQGRPSSTPAWAPTSACTPSTRPSPTARRPRAERRAPARRSTTRCATSCSPAPSCRARRRRASPQIQERLAELSPDVLRARARRDRRLRLLRDARTSSPACPPTWSQAARAAAQARRQGRPQAHAALSELLAGDAVRRATARCASACTAPT